MQLQPKATWFSIARALPSVFHGWKIFRAAKRRIADHMEMRIVALDDDVLGIRSTISEIYVHAILGTPYNDFSPS